MKKFVSILFAVLALLISTVSFAEEAQLGSVKGPQIDLKLSDHAIAGSIKNFVMWGFVDEETFSSDIIIRKDTQLIKATFKKQDDGRTGGVIQHTVDNKELVTSVYLVGVNGKEQKIVLSINGQDVVVSIAGEYKDGHFRNPTYSAVYNGEEIRFTVEGEACYGFSFHLSAMVLGAYLH